MKRFRLFPATIAIPLLVLPSIAFACDTAAVKINIDWLRSNNAGAYNAISNGCRMLNNTRETGSGLQTVVDSYKSGQSHNPSAASAIDGCTAEQILYICN